MSPPWEEYPHIPMYSIGWRMGPGEDYIHSFGGWFTNLSDGEQKAFRSEYPEPESWTGWYDMRIERAQKLSSKAE